MPLTDLGPLLPRAPTSPPILRPVTYYREPFTPEEESVLQRFFTNVDRPVFALINLPEVVKGALFARYSRTSKSIRRLFLDEFVADAETGIAAIAGQLENDPLVDMRKAEQLYQRVFFDYGDDSVAQLGGTHLACEQASNILTKVLEWGRLAAYLEQSTRYIFYDAKLGDRYRFTVPPEIVRSDLAEDFQAYLVDVFDLYSRMVADMKTTYEARFPKQPSDSDMVWRSTIRAKACDATRGLLPAATLSNVGVYATGQAYEMALVRMQAHPLEEVRSYGAMMLDELRKVIPSFLTRVDLPDRGVRWSGYLSDVRRRLTEQAAELPVLDPSGGPSVTLVDWDPEAETKLVASALYAVSDLPDATLLEVARSMPDDQRGAVIAELVGDRSNRRHKPGRPMERSEYRFDVVCDFGAFRDLQRHRLMSIEWQPISTRLGFDLPTDIADAGHSAAWTAAMDRAGEWYERLRERFGVDVAQYAVPFAANMRFVMQMNARQAFHLIELRSQSAGHPAYRHVAHEMHRLIRDVAGHRRIADAMSFVDYSDVELERLESERRSEARRQAASGG